MSGERHDRIAYLPVMTASRELDARIVLALSLGRHGRRSVVGPAGQVSRIAMSAKPGLFVTPTLVRGAAVRLHRLARSGNTLLGWDEEGLVYPDPAWYFRTRLGSASLREVSALVAWGERSARDMVEARPEVGARLLPLGNPRVDLLREPVVSIHRDAVESIRSQHGRFVLVNTNFDLVNHRDGSTAFMDRLRASGRITGAIDEQHLVAWAEFRRAVSDAFVAGLPRLARAFADLTVVVRPHPSEAPQPWREMAARLDNVRVISAADNIVPWLLAADAVVHNSCTTAVEAALLGRPVVAHCPSTADPAMASTLPNEVSTTTSSWDETIDAVRDLRHDREDPAARREREALLDDAVASRSGPLASDAIARLGVAVDTSDQREVRTETLAAMRRNVGRTTTTVGTWVRGVGVGRSAGVPRRDDRQVRQAGLDAESLIHRVVALADRLGERVAVRPLGPHAVVITVIGG